MRRAGLWSLVLIVALAMTALGGCSHTHSPSARPSARDLVIPSATTASSTAVSTGSVQVAAGVSPCSIQDLSTSQAGMVPQGAAGGLYASLEVLNRTAAPCLLSNEVTAADLWVTDGSPLPIRYTLRCTDCEQEFFVLGDHARAVYDLAWDNWCGSPPGPLGVSLTVTGLGVLTAGPSSVRPGRIVLGTAQGDTPTCVESDRPSAIYGDFSWNGGPSAP